MKKKKEKNEIKYSVWLRCYINGKEVYASKRLIEIVRKMHYILDAYECRSFELRRLQYDPDGTVVSNILVTDKAGDLI